jgi:hypothetical protein
VHNDDGDPALAAARKAALAQGAYGLLSAPDGTADENM